jgi:hypothetical protein
MSVWAWVIIASVTWMLLGLAVGLVLGRMIRTADEQEERRQRRLEALVTGEDPKEDVATVERAVIRPARIVRSHPYDPDNNGNI